MKPSALALCLCVVPALWGADALSAQQPTPGALTEGERTALAQALIGRAQMVVQYALFPENMPSAWGPQQLLDEADEFGLSPEQRRAMEVIEARAEQAFIVMMSRMGPPDTTLLQRLWGTDPIDPVDVVLAGSWYVDLENQAILEIVQIEEEMQALLTPEQREQYLRRTEAVQAAYAAVSPRAPDEAAAMLAQMAEAGLLPHPLLLGRSRAAELGLSPSELEHLEALHGQLLEAIAVLGEVTQREPVPSGLTAAELRAVLGHGDARRSHDRLRYGIAKAAGRGIWGPRP